MQKLKQKISFPTKAEDDAINAGIAADPEARELDKEWFRNARPAHSVLKPEVYEAIVDIKRGRGRPISETPKIFTGLRLDADILEAFKATGKGWQTKMNAALRQYLDEHRLES